MGVVYEARDPARPETRLALKLILAHGAGPEELARFQREGEALAKFRHPNVVGVHDLLQTPRGPCLVTDLIEGEELATLRKRQAWTPRACAELLRELADAVGALHAKGLIHRDLKPQNVMLTAAGRPILLDFGLVRQRGAEALTQTGALLGTPSYMSPEQAGGDARVDELTDVYALGAILYYLITGEPPFTGSVVQVLQQVMRGTPPPPPSSRVEAGARDPALDAICLRAMAGSPGARYPSARDLRDALDAYLAPPSPARSARWIGALGLGLLLLAALTLVALGARDPAPAPADPATVAGDDALAALLGSSSPAARLGAPELERWLAAHGEHPSAPRVEALLEATRELEATLDELPALTPAEAERRLAQWGHDHPEHPDALPADGSWLRSRLEAIGEIPRLRRRHDLEALSAWEARCPDLPTRAWLGDVYRRFALEQDLWVHETTQRTPQVAFLPGARPLRFVTWSFGSWTTHDPLRLWELRPGQTPIVAALGHLELAGGAVLDVATGDDGELSVLIGLRREHPAPGSPRLQRDAADYDSGLVRALPLTAFDGVARDAESLIDDGPFGDWRRWLARVDVDGEARFAVAGNRNQRIDGREVAGETEGAVLLLPGGLELTSRDPARDVAFSDDGALLALAAGRYAQGMRTIDLPPQAVTVFAAATGEVVERNTRFPALPNRVWFLPGTRTLVLTTHAHNVHLYDEAAGWRRLQGADAQSVWGGEVPSHNGIVRGAVVDPSGRYLLTISGMSPEDMRTFARPNEVRVWDLHHETASDRDDSRLTDLRAGLFDVSLAPGGHWLLLGSERRVVLRQWLPPLE